jgi:hypothetical protein
MVRKGIMGLAVFVAALWLSPASARAQPLIIYLFGDKMVTDNFQPGLTVSFMGTGFVGTSGRMRVSWSIGVYGEVRLTDRLSIVPELLLKCPGGARKLDPSVQAYPFEPESDPALDDLISTGDVTRELRSVGIPVVLRWRLGSVGLGMGPQLSVLIRADDTVSAKRGGRPLSYTDSVRSALTGYDIGVVGSIDYGFSDGDPLRSMRVRLKGVMGLVDTVQDNPERAIRNWSFSVGLDIPIGSPSQDKTIASASKSGSAVR